MSVDREGMPRGIFVQSACSSPVCSRLGSRSRYTGLQQPGVVDVFLDAAAEKHAQLALGIWDSQ